MGIDTTHPPIKCDETVDWIKFVESAPAHPAARIDCRFLSTYIYRYINWYEFSWALKEGISHWKICRIWLVDIPKHGYAAVQFVLCYDPSLVFVIRCSHGRLVTNYWNIFHETQDSTQRSIRSNYTRIISATRIYIKMKRLHNLFIPLHRGWEYKIVPGADWRDEW